MHKKRKFFAVLMAFCLVNLSLPQGGFSEFYRYVDKDGKIFYIDDLSRVPPEYRDQVQVYKEKYDYLPQEQRSAERAKDREREHELELEHQRSLEGELQRQAESEQAEKLRRAQMEAEKKIETKVVIEGNRVLVPVLLGNNGIEVKAMLLLDTGASQVVVHRNIADQLKIITLTKSLAVVAGGQTIQSEIGRLSYLRVGPFTMKDPTVVILDYGGPAAGHSGLLGMNFLRQVQYSVDFEDQVIRWQPAQTKVAK